MIRIYGDVAEGDVQLTVAGIGIISQPVMGSYPTADVAVYFSGTAVLAPIYSNNASTPTPLSNPFQSDEDGHWFFYAPNGRYDIAFSGGGLSEPFTLGDVQAFDYLNFTSQSIASLSLDGVRMADQFNFAAQFPAISLSAGVSATVTLTPVPPGVNGIDANHYLYVSGGTGTAEAVLITGGTAVAGATSGTVTFTPLNNHTGSWMIASASGGIQEAIVDIGAAGGQIYCSTTTFNCQAQVTIAVDDIRLVGANEGATVLLFSGATHGILVQSPTQLENVLIENLSVITSNASGQNAVYFNQGSPPNAGQQVTLRNLQIGVTGSGAWQHGVFLNNMQGCSLYDVFCSNVTVGFHLDNVSNANTLFNCATTGTYTTGIEIAGGSDNTTIVGGTFQGAISNALIAQSGSAVGLTIEGGHFETTSNTPNGIIGAFSYLSLHGTEFTNHFASAINVTQGGVIFLNGCWLSCSASVAIINVAGVVNSNPTTITDCWINNSHATGLDVIVDGVFNGKIDGGQYQTVGGDCISLGPTTGPTCFNVVNAHIVPGGSAKGVNIHSGNVNVLGNRFGVALSQAIAGSPVLQLGNVFLGSAVNGRLKLTDTTTALQINSTRTIALLDIIASPGQYGIFMSADAAQSQDLLRITDSITNPKVKVDSSFNLTGQAALFTGNVTSQAELIGVDLRVTAATPTVSGGQLGLGTSTATSATAGSNGDVPAQVAGYLIFNQGGTIIKVPFYNA